MSYFLFSIRKQINITNLVSVSVTNKTPNLLQNPPVRECRLEPQVRQRDRDRR